MCNKERFHPAVAFLPTQGFQCCLDTESIVGILVDRALRAVFFSSWQALLCLWRRGVPYSTAAANCPRTSQRESDQPLHLQLRIFVSSLLKCKKLPINLLNVLVVAP